MADRGGDPPADGEPGLRADQFPIRLAQRLTGHDACLVRIHLIAARGQKQHHAPVAFAPPEDDRLDDLVDLAARRACRIGGGPGALGHLQDLDRLARRLQCRAHAVQGFAHGFCSKCFRGR